MATWELQLLSRVIKSGELNTVMEWGVTLDDFLTPEGKTMWSTIAGYHAAASTTGSTIGPYAAQQAFPNFILCDDAGMTTEALCFEVRKSRLTHDFRTELQGALDIVDTDPMAAVNRAQNVMTSLQNLGFSKQTDVHFHDAFNRVINKMHMIEQGIDLSRGAWPWKPLQDVTGGLQPADYVVLYGRPKNMKSWILAFLIAWFHDLGKRMIIYTKEMTADNIFQRAGACLAGVRYHEFRVNPGALTYAEKNSIYGVQRMLNRARLDQTVVCLSGKDAADGGDTVPWLRSKIETHKPDVIFVDGMYLMTDAKGHKKPNEKVGSISNDLRRLTLDTEIPLIATIQANREAAKNQDANLDEIGFSDKVGQDATLLMRCINEKNAPTVALVMGGASREFQLNGFRVYGIPATNFGYAGEITDKEIEKAKEGDVSDNDKGNAKRTPAPKAKRTTEHAAAQHILRKVNKLL